MCRTARIAAAINPGEAQVQLLPVLRSPCCHTGASAPHEQDQERPKRAAAASARGLQPFSAQGCHANPHQRVSKKCSACMRWGAAAHSALQAQVHHLSEECRKLRNAAAAGAGELRHKSRDLSHAELRVKRLRQQLEQKHVSASSLQVVVVYSDGCVCWAACSMRQQQSRRRPRQVLRQNHMPASSQHMQKLQLARRPPGPCVRGLTQPTPCSIPEAM